MTGATPRREKKTDGEHEKSQLQVLWESLRNKSIRYSYQSRRGEEVDGFDERAKLSGPRYRVIISCQVWRDEYGDAGYEVFLSPRRKVFFSFSLRFLFNFGASCLNPLPIFLTYSSASLMCVHKMCCTRVHSAVILYS